MPQQTRKLAAILCADVVGYSARMGANEHETLKLLNEMIQSTLEPQVDTHNGRIFKRMGDGILAEFGSVVDAVECALGIQRHVQEVQDTDRSGLELRIGINLGDVIAQDDDVFGEGVNVAARLEPIAPVGGIALSEAVFHNIIGKVVAVFEDIGAQQLKNIANPVHVYCWPERTTKPEAAVQAGTGLPLRRKPGLIVLPFKNASDNPDYDSFADGIAEDVIYGLSRSASIDVIGRYTAFAYRGQKPSIAQLYQDLGVRYVVEGRVRRFGTKTRISVELADTTKGIQIWSNQWNEDLSDILDTIDQIVEQIVAILPGQIFRAEKERIRRKPPSDMTAYDHLIAGRLCHHRVQAVKNREAVGHLEKAIDLDGDYADAYAWKACVLGQAVQFGFSEDAAKEETEAFEMLDRALELDSEHLECHRLLSEVCMMTGKMDQAAVHNERALAMNPVDPRLLAQKGEVLTWLGRPEEGIPWLEKALQLDPFGAPGRAHLMGNAYHAAKRYEDAIQSYALIPSANPAKIAEAAACRARLGDEGGARGLVAEALRHDPNFSVSNYASSKPFASDEDTKHLQEGLRLAGFPD